MLTRPEDLTKIAEGREAEIFAWEGGTVLRLLRSPEAREQAEWEAAAMETARSSGIRVPEVHGVVEALGRPGVVMARIAGEDYLTILGKRPWLIFHASRVLGEVHAQLHAVRAPDSLRPLKATLRTRIERTDQVPERLKPFALEVLDGLPDGDAICHGDYHPANLIVASGEPVLIDWTNVTRGHPHADVARTLLLLRLGEPPPGTPSFVRYVQHIGRRIMLWQYARSYRSVRSFDTEAVRRWDIPLTAVRMTEGIESERPALLKILEARRGHGG